MRKHIEKTKDLFLKTHEKFIRPKKSLGQNFLKSVLALKIIIEAGEINLKKDTILEIGPGKGALTEKLLEKAKKVIAIEKDRTLIEMLKIKFVKEVTNNPTLHKATNGHRKLILIEDDILKYNTETLGKYKIIANIPYNITGAILKKFLTAKNPPTLMVLMVQNEVAKRIVARDNKESILSISVKAYGVPKMIMKVPARYFSPAPKVDSAILQIKDISKKFFTSPQPSPDKGEGVHIDEEKFWELIHAGFAHKRKKLSNNLKKLVKNLPEEYKNKRAENLTLADWQKIIQN